MSDIWSEVSLSICNMDLDGRLVNTVGYHITVLFGFGGQKIVVIPELKVVISMLAEMNGPHPENSELVHNMIEKLMITKLDIIEEK